MTTGSLVALGEASRVSAFALGGATVIAADDPEAVRRAWEMLPDDVSLVVLTEMASDSLRAARPRRDGVLRVVMP